MDLGWVRQMKCDLIWDGRSGRCHEGGWVNVI